MTDEASEKDVKLRVTVSIVTSAAGSPFSGSGKYTVEEGSTVFDVLGLLCEANDWNIDGDGNYVRGINGLCEFDHGSSSGWMYKVNGRYPGVSCGDYILSDGDKVVWVYVTSIQNIDGQ